MRIAKSFSLIFFRNAINNGLLVIELQDGIDAMDKGDTLSIDFEKEIVNHEGNEYHFPSFPKEGLAIPEDDGLIPHVRKALG